MTEAPNESERTEYHCFSRARVGTTMSVLRPTRSIALTATAVFPAPVGRTTTPRRPGGPDRQAARASLWYGRGSSATRDSRESFLEGRGAVVVRRLVVAEAQDGLPIRARRGAPLAGAPVPYERLRQARRRGAGRD